jgi:hypothetical protein
MFTMPFTKTRHPEVALEFLRDEQLDGQFAALTAAIEALLPGGDRTFARLPPEIASPARDLLAVFAPKNAPAPSAKAPRAGSKSKRTSPRSRRG